ncbi:presequence protease 1 chloroplastic/mitochondrial-like, partial [Trifolium medium]|nr:presequence protease 1 chloroplastic/mitochondrial-like [Trifolium medium]
KISEEFIPECKSKAVLFRHVKTGAQVMSVSNNDENKVFGIVFRTPPTFRLFNRRVGTMSSIILLKISLIKALCPDNTYGVDSGGDPRVIPKLTFEEFKEFHRKYYHPSNSRIWFYGDDDPNERLRILSGNKI